LIDCFTSSPLWSRSTRCVRRSETGPLREWFNLRGSDPKTVTLTPSLASSRAHGVLGGWKSRGQQSRHGITTALREDGVCPFDTLDHVSVTQPRLELTRSRLRCAMCPHRSGDRAVLERQAGAVGDAQRPGGSVPVRSVCPRPDDSRRRNWT
jgi:hypothetical protein